jgi:hypothetical protein
MKEELNKDMENPRKKNQTKILEIKSFFNQRKNIVEDQSSRLEQVEDIISGLEDKIDIKEEIFDKKFKSHERNMQELSNSIKRPNLRIMCIEEGEVVQAEEICNIVSKIMAENLQNL